MEGRWRRSEKGWNVSPVPGTTLHNWRIAGVTAHRGEPRSSSHASPCCQYDALQPGQCCSCWSWSSLCRHRSRQDSAARSSIALWRHLTWKPKVRPQFLLSLFSSVVCMWRLVELIQDFRANSLSTGRGGRLDADYLYVFTYILYID